MSKKTKLQEYQVLKVFTGEKIYNLTDKLLLDPKKVTTKHLITNKFIK